MVFSEVFVGGLASRAALAGEEYPMAEPTAIAPMEAVGVMRESS